jgi:hypothetical protein
MWICSTNKATTRAVLAGTGALLNRPYVNRQESLYFRVWLSSGRLDASHRQDARTCLALRSFCMPDHAAPADACLDCPTCGCDYAPACPPPHGATRTHGSPCLLLRVSLWCVLRARPCRLGPDLFLQYSDETHTTFRWSIHLKHMNIMRLRMKTFATWSTCCNIRLKYVKHLKHWL